MKNFVEREDKEKTGQTILFSVEMHPETQKLIKDAVERLNEIGTVINDRGDGFNVESVVNDSIHIGIADVLKYYEEELLLHK
jgi:hypothetical protein